MTGLQTVCSLGTSDVDGDGAEEVLFGTPFNNGSYPNEAGTVYVFAMLACDLDGDGDLNEDDFAVFLAAYGRSGGEPEYNAVCDIDDDGTVTIVDYQLWLACYRKFTGGGEAPLLGLPDDSESRDRTLGSEERGVHRVGGLRSSTESRPDRFGSPDFAEPGAGP